jgi:EAL domain-containing protein (putative c-di-GMP-specific phosphodiesterase class I)/CheY-like chemotaxis protein
MHASTMKVDDEFTPRAGTGTDHRLQKFKIVITDPAEDTLKLLGLILSPKYELISYQFPEAALEELLQNGADLVICGVEMPQMTGYAFCRAIKSSETLSDVPVILMSGFGDASKALECGADDYIIRPFRSQIFLDLVADVLSTRSDKERMSLDPLGQTLLLTEAETHFVNKTTLPPLKGALPTLYNAITEIRNFMTIHKQVGVIFLEIAPISGRHEDYRLRYFHQFILTVGEFLKTMRGKVIRDKDIIVANRPMGSSFIMFLSLSESEPPELQQKILEFKIREAKDFLQTAIQSVYTREIVQEFSMNFGFSRVEFDPKPMFLRLLYRFIKDAEIMAAAQVAERKHESESEFRKILDFGLLRTLFQPIFHSIADKLVVYSYEALSRGPNRSNLESPDALFKIAEELGAVDPLDMRCVQTAVETAEPLTRNSLLFLNVETSSICLSPFKKLFSNLTSIVPANRIVFELTERSDINNYLVFADHLAYFRGLGVRIALDDAGSGYSSLNHIVKIQPDFIKLDMVLIQGIDTDLIKKNLVASFVSFAKSSDILVIAEGIETAAEFETLQAIGVDMFQGYYLQRPGEISQFSP